jgi:uncharacterized protein
VLWFEPDIQRAKRRLAILLTGLGGTKESMIPLLRDLAAAGFVALSFDPWQHGVRGTETSQQLGKRVFSNFRRNMWPILGQTALDTLRVIDWAVASLGVAPRVVMGGTSMGGDISVAAVGIDRRIERVAAFVATPDWLRPGMRDGANPPQLIPPGEPDAYAQFFYDRLNPLTHLDAYAHGPAIDFACGELDTHVPPDGALRFHAALREQFPAAAERMQVNLIPGMGHGGTPDRNTWWRGCLEWLAT